MTINNATIATNLYPVANGTVSSNPFVDEFKSVDPTIYDIQYPIQKKWLNTTDGGYWELQNFTTSQGVVFANWVLIGRHATVTETLTGNDGIAVPPTNNNINVLGDVTNILTSGNIATSTLTISLNGNIANQYVEDIGTAIPALGILNVLGGPGITTNGAGNTITINGQPEIFSYTNVVGPITYAVLPTDHYISCNSTAGAITLNFPNAPAANRIWTVKDRTGTAVTHNITLSTPGGTVTFDGLTSYIMNSNYQAVDILANATPTYEIY